jgi:hypothetical protein
MSQVDPISFLSDLQAKVYEMATRDLEQNHDADRFGAEPERTPDPVFQKRQNITEAIARLKNSKSNPLVLLETYQLLEDEYSRGVLLELYFQRLMGFQRVKISRNSKQYWLERNLARSLQTNRLPAKKIKFMNWELPHFDLSGIGFDLNLFYIPIGLDFTFIKKTI